jgi:hypothetical protein
MYRLRDMLCKQLEDYGKKGELSAAVLERVDMLAHAVKNLDKVIEAEGGAVSNSGYGYSCDSYGDVRTSNRRDSMGRYSRSSGDISSRLRDMMEDAPDDRTRQEIQRLVSRLDQR